MPNRNTEKLAGENNFTKSTQPIVRRCGVSAHYQFRKKVQVKVIIVSMTCVQGRCWRELFPPGNIFQRNIPPTNLWEQMFKTVARIIKYSLKGTAQLSTLGFLCRQHSKLQSRDKGNYSTVSKMARNFTLSFAHQVCENLGGP